jgi:hypothetical protein
VTVPDWWQAIVLVLASYRLTRLGGWDAWPPAAKIRARLIGEEWTAEEQRVIDEYDALSQFPRPQMQEIGQSVDLPGKQPSSPIEGVRPGYRRPTLAHLVHCPFCLGWWVTLTCWGAFEFWPHGALVALSPFALAGAVGLVGKDLD